MEAPPFNRWLVIVGGGCLVAGLLLGHLLSGGGNKGAASPSAGHAVPATDPSRLRLGATSEEDEENADTSKPATVNFVAEMHAAMAQGDEWIRLRRLHRTIDRLEKGEIEAAAEQIRRLPPRDRWMVARVLGEHWGQLDPLKALEFAKKLAPNEGREIFVHGAFQKWASGDPEAAKEWLDKQPATEFSMRAPALGAALAKRDPVGALAILEKLPGE